MKRFSFRVAIGISALIAALGSCVGLGLWSIYAATTTPPTDQAKFERAKLQHERLRALIATHLDLETTKQHQLQHLQEKYLGIDFTTIYNPSDLTSMTGINRARQRLDLYGAMTTELDAVMQQYWDDWERAINSNDLDEPLAGALISGFSRAEPEIAGNYAGWIQAMRGSSAAISQLLKVAQRHLGKFSLLGDQLRYRDAVTAKEFESSLRYVAAAAQRNNDARHAALGARDPTRPLIRAALLQAEEST
ncbi:MAG: hypothetical protein WA642_12755 [Steroidobacteraceae bacterium]